MTVTYALAATASPPNVRDYLVLHTLTPPRPELAALAAPLEPTGAPSFRPVTLHGADDAWPYIERPEPGNAFLTALTDDHMAHPATIHLSDAWNGLIDPPRDIARTLRPHLDPLFGHGLSGVRLRRRHGAGPDGRDALLLDLEIAPVPAPRTPRNRGGVWL
jgi:hypothetical protein